MIEIIAEIGQNHNGDMILAKELISAAKANGADAAKFQVYDVNKVFTKEGNPWYDYNCKTELSKDDVLELVEECTRLNIEFMASAFDIERVAWLEEVNVKRHKLASRSINDNELIQAMIATHKPILVSLGMWDGCGFPKIFQNAPAYYLYCVSKYPTSFEDLKFEEIDFNIYAGFSDHTIGLEAAKLAMSKGAKIVEKHFTLDKKMYGPDHEGSMIPEELGQLSLYRNEIIKSLSK